MSVRSTPGPTSYPSLPTYQTPDASSSRRSIRAPSYAPSYISRPSIPDFTPNQPFSRGSIAPSVTGTSTPTVLGIGRRRRNDKNQNPIDGAGTPTSKDDWASMEPDEVFRKLPVNEVKRVESKMRSDALNKQSELRSMVGTRYRDLLTSATQIESLHASSLRLSDSLREIARTCSNPDINITLDGEDEDDGKENEEDDLIIMLPTAAHMKLLLDAPEALYSYLAHHSYLNAAFLWLITRVVKESLSAMPEEQNGPYLSLLQKQWETLLPFRSQIVQRATISLRTQDKFDSKSLSETILSIILLDNLPIQDALDLLLTQRTKSLKDTLQHTDSSKKNSLSPEKEKISNRKRSNSRIQSAAINRSILQERSSIQSIITDSVKLMLETISSIKTVFDQTSNITRKGIIKEEGEESLIESMMRLIQKGDNSVSSMSMSNPKSTAASATPMRKNSHQRRASRLASISLPLKYSPSSTITETDTSAASKPPITSSEIISNLPSSQILLRHLPNNIIGFTPFIISSRSPNLSEITNNWEKSSVNLLKESIPDWLKDLKNVKDIWTIRNSLNVILSNKDSMGEFEESIKQALEDQWSIRVKEVWKEKLDQLIDLSEKELRDAGEKVRNGIEKTDNTPESFLFSDLSFPSGPAPTFSATSHTTAFSNFRSILGKRSSYRTPLLDSVLVTFEDTAKSIKEDMSDLPSSLYDDYSEQIQVILNSLVKVLEKVLDSMGSSRGDGKVGIEAEIFIGRIALYLGKQSDFLGNIAGYGKIDQDIIVKSLIEVHSKSVIRWRDRSIQEALVLLAPLFEPYRGSQEVKSSWQGEIPSSPSHCIIISLKSLVNSTKSLGIPPSLINPDLNVVEELIKSYVKNVKELEGWKSQEENSENALQALVDLGFLVHVSGNKVEDDELVEKFLNIISSTYPSFTISTLNEIIQQSIRKSQLLIYPLLTHLSPVSTPKLGGKKSYSHGIDNRNAALLKFGTPQSTSTGTGTGTEFRSPVVANKPGKRMGLLSITA